MIIFKYIFWTLYRIWFYILVAIPIIVLLPVIVLSLLKESWYPYFFKIARFWAKFIMIGMGFPWKVEHEQIPNPKHSYMFVANHTSLTDIMLMLVTVKNPFVFVGKAELDKIPIFGFIYKRSCILVDRSNSESRRAVFESAQRRLNQGLSVCIFPEGGVPDESIELDTFKDGAFRLAIEHKIPIVPLTFADNKKRFSFTFFSGMPGVMRVKVHKFFKTENLVIEDKKVLKEQVRDVILKQLHVFNG